MLRRLRHASYLLSPLAVCLVALVLFGTVDWWHVSDAESALPAVHNHAEHHPILTNTGTPSQPEGDHCYLCHWLRTLQNGLKADTLHNLAGQESRRVQPVSVSRSSVSISSLLPARAPPL